MKGVILAAGYGTRFLPGTKTIPKEMFPLVDVPTIHYIVEEMAEAKIRDILIVTSRRKKSLEDYFDREVELERILAQEGSEAKLAKIRPPDVNVFFLRQQRMAGTGDALLSVEPFVGDAPFVVAYPDDLLLTGPSLSGQLAELHERTHKTVLAGQEVLDRDVSRYGVVDSRMENGVETVRAMVEKPAPGTEPSRVVAFGRYLYTADLFPALRETREAFQGAGEFTQTDAINLMASRGQVVVKRFEGKLLDVGTPMGYLQAIVESGLHREEFREEFAAYLREVVKREGLG